MSAAILGGHLPALTVLLPALTAVALLLAGDHGGDAHGAAGRRRLARARGIALASTAAGLLLAIELALQAASGDPIVYRMGDWPAPFGIVLVVDRLSALMLVLASTVALPVLCYATGGWDARGRHFHPLFQFQLMGLAGAFVTGDLFNLFVFFEVLLLASYTLLVHGLGRERLRAGVQYVVLNLTASALFLVGVALIYALTGTLNMADLALRVPAVGGAEAAVLRAASLLLLVVFGFKAALVPLAMWLPATYAAACAPVAALFAIMTKVGVYAILRVNGVIFGPEAGASALAAQPWLLPLALLTGGVGVLGALAAGTFARLVAWLTVASVGTILAALGLYTDAAWSAGLYYLVQSTLVIASLFLIAELVAAQRGEAGDRLEPARPVANPALLGLMLLLAAAAAAGLPPLPGFLGKVMILKASSAHDWQALIWSVILAAGFVSLLGLARAGNVLFWHVRDDLPADGAAAPGARRLVPALALLGAAVGMSAFADSLMRYTDAAAAQLRDRAAYARAVLPEQGGEAADTARPYRAVVPQEAP